MDSDEDAPSLKGQVNTEESPWQGTVNIRREETW